MRREFNLKTYALHITYTIYLNINETANISLNINWLVFVAENQYISCEVRTGFLNIIQ
jgi:hypothetical protein